MTSTEFQSHQAFEKPDQIQARIKDHEFAEKVDIVNLDFLKTASDFTRNRFKITTPSLVQIADINTIAQELDAVLVN